jgi:hypothetical protein
LIVVAKLKRDPTLWTYLSGNRTLWFLFIRKLQCSLLSVGSADTLQPTKPVQQQKIALDIDIPCENKSMWWEAWYSLQRNGHCFHLKGVAKPLRRNETSNVRICAETDTGTNMVGFGGPFRSLHWSTSPHDERHLEDSHHHLNIY